MMTPPSRPAGAVKRVCIVVSHPETVRNFLRFQLEELSLIYEISVVANVGTGGLSFLSEAIRCHPIRIERKPSPLRILPPSGVSTCYSGANGSTRSTR